MKPLVLALLGAGLVSGQAHAADVGPKTVSGQSWARRLAELELRAHRDVAAITLSASPDAGKPVTVVGTASRAGGGRTGRQVKAALQDVSHDPIGELTLVFSGAKSRDPASDARTVSAIQADISRHLISNKNAFDPYPYDRAYRDDTLAQTLVDKTVRAHPEIIVLAIHATPPGSKQNVILGSTIGRIGKKADEDDLRVIEKGSTNLEVAENGKRFEVELPLNDASGARIGALGVVTAYKAGDDKQAKHARAEAIRDELAREIPSPAALVQPRGR